MTGITIANRYLCSRGLRPCFRLVNNYVVSGRVRWKADTFHLFALEAAAAAEAEIIEGLGRSRSKSDNESDTYKTFLDSERVRSIARRRPSNTVTQT